jgi:hypothetical protein
MAGVIDLAYAENKVWLYTLAKKNSDRKKVAASVRESLRTFCMKFAQKTKDLEIPDNQ